VKILSIVTGLLITAFMISFITGWISFDGGINEIIKKGNEEYGAKNYQQALETYQKGLNKHPDNAMLNYNSGQALYQLAGYNEAINYYAKAENTPDKYINSGNCSVKLAESTDDPVQKQQLYQQALETYKEGIIAFPQNIPLKYNYEYVKSKLDELKEQNNQQQDENENQENKDDQNNNKNQQGNDSQQDDNQNDNPEQNTQNRESPGDNSNDNSEQKNNEESQQFSQDKETAEQDESQKDNKEQNSLSMNESDPSDSDQSDSNIAQILRMLEKQEEQSLKNNQEIRRSTKEDEYDW